MLGTLYVMCLWGSSLVVSACIWLLNTLTSPNKFDSCRSHQQLSSHQCSNISVLFGKSVQNYQVTGQFSIKFSHCLIHIFFPIKVTMIDAKCSNAFALPLDVTLYGLYTTCVLASHDLDKFQAFLFVKISSLPPRQNLGCTTVCFIYKIGIKQTVAH